MMCATPVNFTPFVLLSYHEDVCHAFLQRDCVSESVKAMQVVCAAPLLSLVWGETVTSGSKLELLLFKLVLNGIQQAT